MGSPGPLLLKAPTQGRRCIYRTSIRGAQARVHRYERSWMPRCGNPPPPPGAADPGRAVRRTRTPESSTLSEVIHRNPKVIGYTMAPVALPVLIVLRKYGLVAHTPIWFYVVVFVGVPVSLLCGRPDLRGSRRIPVHKSPGGLARASVTIVIYMSGWGPEIVGAYGFVLVDNIARTRARTWRIVAFWIVCGSRLRPVGHLVWLAPSFLSGRRANALARSRNVRRPLRRPDARRHGRAEGACRGRAPQQRGAFPRPRAALLRHDVDHRRRGLVTFASPAVETLIGRTPRGGRRHSGYDDYIHPDEAKGSRLSSRPDSRTGSVTEPVQFRMGHVDGAWRYVRRS